MSRNVWLKRKRKREIKKVVQEAINKHKDKKKDVDFHVGQTVYSELESYIKNKPLSIQETFETANNAYRSIKNNERIVRLREKRKINGS